MDLTERSVVGELGIWFHKKIITMSACLVPCCRSTNSLHIHQIIMYILKDFPRSKRQVLPSSGVSINL
ncbi:hypothetical protein ACA910_014874 [Epithemia clementina (nom. ined.)]